jgi:hypothetical protein
VDLSGTVDPVVQELSRLRTSVEDLGTSPLQAFLATYVIPVLSIATAVVVPLIIALRAAKASAAEAKRSRDLTLATVRAQISSQNRLAADQRRRDIVARALVASARFVDADTLGDALRRADEIRYEMSALHLELGKQPNVAAWLQSMESAMISALGPWANGIDVWAARSEWSSDFESTLIMWIRRDIDDRVFGRIFAPPKDTAFLTLGPAPV